MQSDSPKRYLQPPLALTDQTNVSINVWLWVRIIGSLILISSIYFDLKERVKILEVELTQIKESIHEIKDHFGIASVNAP